MRHGAVALLPFLTLLTACGLSGPNDDAPPSAPALRTYPDKMVNHWTTFADWDETKIEEAAEATMMIVPIERCFAPESKRVLDGIHALNPDFKVIGYQSLMGVLRLYPDTTYLRAELPYALDYYNAVRGDWAWSTAGDTVLIWPDIVFLNPIKNGAINRDLISTIVDLIARYQAQSGSALDGIMHDYFMYAPYLNPSVADDMIGDVDFDGDGVPFNDDPDEKALFMQFQIAEATAIRTRFGSDFIQIGNGRPPQEMPELAALLNGIYYEFYPNNPWGKTDRDGLLRLLENQAEGYLQPAKGRTWSVCTNEHGDLNNNSNNTFCLLSSLIANCMYADLQGQNIFNGWTIDLEPGQPLGPAIIEGNTDSMLTVRREFDRGEVRISFFPSGRREEYRFLAADSLPR
jgi:hypothetical protein